MGWLIHRHLINTTNQNPVKINTAVSLITTSKNSLKKLGYLVHPLSSLTINLFKTNSFTSFRFINSSQPRKTSSSKIHLTFNIWIDFLILAVTASANPIFNQIFLILIIIKTFKINSSLTVSRIFWVRWKMRLLIK